MRLYQKIYEASEQLSEYLETNFCIDYDSFEINSPNKDIISIEMSASLNEKLINHYHKINLSDEFILDIKNLYTKWYLDETLEYLRYNDYNPEGAQEKIESPLQDLYGRRCPDDDELEEAMAAANTIRDNYEEIEAFYSFDMGYYSFFEDESRPDIHFNFDIIHKNDNKRPFICRFEWSEFSTKKQLSLTRNYMPSNINMFYYIANKTIQKAFPKIKHLPFS